MSEPTLHPTPPDPLVSVLREMIGQHFISLTESMQDVRRELGTVREKVGEMSGAVSAMNDRVGLLTLRVDNAGLRALANSEKASEKNGASEDDKDKRALERVVALVVAKGFKSPLRAAASIILTAALGGGSTMALFRGCSATTAGTSAIVAHAPAQATPTPGAAQPGRMAPR